LFPLRGPQQGAHRRVFVGEDPDIALRTRKCQRLGQRIERGPMVAVGRQRQRPQGLNLDDASGTALARGRGEQPLQQRQCRPARSCASSTHARTR